MESIIKTFDNGAVAPLVSFCLKSYNQKEYIRDALDCAFKQTYHPLEIVVCDDGSTDGSDELIRTMITAYLKNGGDHKVRYSRNETNIGIALNCQKAYLMAKGDLIINADGDDISYPHRTSEIVKAWLADGRRASVILHDADLIDFSGRRLNKLHGVPSPEYPFGAMMAYSRKVVTDFGSIIFPGCYDDDVFSWRAMMLGGVVKVRLPLIAYRIGTGSTTKGNFFERRKRASVMCLESAKQIELDLERGGIEKYSGLKTLLQRYRVRYSEELRMLQGGSWIMQIVHWAKYCRACGFRLYGRPAFHVFRECILRR